MRERSGGVCNTPLQPAGRHVLDFVIIIFSSLDGRKEAKEDQGLTEAGEFGRVQVGVEKRPGKMAGYMWEWKRGQGIRPGMGGGGKWGIFFFAPSVADRYLSGGGFNIGARALLLQAILNNPAAHVRDALHFLQI